MLNCRMSEQIAYCICGKAARIPVGFSGLAIAFHESAHTERGTSGKVVIYESEAAVHSVYGGITFFFAVDEFIPPNLGADVPPQRI